MKDEIAAIQRHTEQIASVRRRMAYDLRRLDEQRQESIDSLHKALEHVPDAEQLYEAIRNGEIKHIATTV